VVKRWRGGEYRIGLCPALIGFDVRRAEHEENFDGNYAYLASVSSGMSVRA